MAELEKGNSSGKDKGKVSHLDEDISSDFLTSWKSMSMTGDDDMDFNFEPVTKGNKKAFDFGKLDMDFSLGQFGKLSSFKMDMPDLDFSSSPKKSTKSKEKSEDESVKENISAKKNDFKFSFDFEGYDDFSLEAPSTKGGNNKSREKSNERVGSMDKIGSDDLHRKALKDNEAPQDIINKRPATLAENTVNAKSEDLVNAEGNLDTLPRSPPNSEIVVDSVQPKGIQITSQIILAADAQEMGHECHLPGQTSNKSYDRETVCDSDFVPNSRSTSKPIPVNSVSTHVAPETKLRMHSQGCDKEIQATEKNSKLSYTDLKAKDRSTKPLLAKTLTQSNVTEVMDVCSADGTLNNPPPEACTDTTRLPPATSASDIVTVKLQKLSEQVLTDKPSKEGDEKNEMKTAVASSSASFALDIADPSRPGVQDTLSSYHTDVPRSTFKFFPASFRSGSTAAKLTTIAYEVHGGKNSKFSRLKETNDGATKLSTLENNREETTKLDNKERKEENVMKLDDNSSSSTKTLVYQDSVSGKTEKNAHADNDFSREIDENVNVKIRDEVGVNAASQDGKAPKNERMLQSEKINDSKLSSFQVPSLVSSGQKTKLSNQDHGNPKDQIQSRTSIPKSNFSEPNRLSSLSFGKKLRGLPSLKLPGNVDTTKHSVSPIMLENAKSGRKLEKGVRPVLVTNMIPSITSEKQRPSTPSLKRKPCEVADVRSIKLPPSKRFSPDNNRMAKEVSTTEFEDDVSIQGTRVEASGKNFAAKHQSPEFDFCQAAKMEELGLVESDENIEKAEACAKELDDICSMLKKKHEEAKELLVRALVNNNHLLMLNHPMYEEKIRAVQKFAAKVMSKEREVEF